MTRAEREKLVWSLGYVEALVRRYRVSGKREPMLAEQVIEHAIALGMEEQG